MPPDQIHLLRRSFARIEPQAELAALEFYRRLFELAPGVRPLFKSNIEEQAAKLMDMIGLAVSLTDRLGSLEEELREAGARHLGYGAREEHYAVVGAALLDMLSTVLGDEFTPATLAAWREFYDLIADAMKQGAAAAMASRSEPGPDAMPPNLPVGQ